MFAGDEPKIDLTSPLQFARDLQSSDRGPTGRVVPALFDGVGDPDRIAPARVAHGASLAVVAVDIISTTQISPAARPALPYQSASDSTVSWALRPLGLGTSHSRAPSKPPDSSPSWALGHRKAVR